MRAIPAVRAARGGLSGRRVQTMVIGLVLLISTAASTLALGLLVDSNAPFDHAFAARHGSEVTATVRAPAPQLAATAHLPVVTAAAGPFLEITVTGTMLVPPPPGQSGPSLPMRQQLTVAGRASPGGPVDDLTLISGHWATRPGQVVLLTDGRGPGVATGTRITVTGVPGSLRLTVVGSATSITKTAQAWVAPAEIAALRAPGTPEVAQMLYRFSRAGTTAQVIVANVVSGAVVAGTRRIGVLKSVGFSPAQVVASYVIQVAVPAFLGCLAGVVAGNLLSVPLLSQTAQVYGVGALAVPVWVDVAVPLTMLGLAGMAALLLALRAGRMSAVQAIATGRAPRPAHGYAAHRVLGRGPWARLPRAVTIGLAGPFARPARTTALSVL